MCDAVIVILPDQWGHRYDILRIVVLDGLQIAELSLASIIICNDI